MKTVLKFLSVSLVATLLTATVSASIPKIEEKSFPDLIKAAKNQSLTMTERWQSLIKAGEIAKPSQIAEIKKFSGSNEWFMRNAALVTLETISYDLALAQAKILVKDKALVVRSAAVTTLTKKNSIEVRQILVEELGKSYNFSGRHSLWIRPQIMKHLVKTVNPEDRQIMVRFLFDSDKNIAALSAEALGKLTSIHFEGEEAVDQWKKHVKKNGWL